MKDESDVCMIMGNLTMSRAIRATKVHIGSPVHRRSRSRVFLKRNTDRERITDEVPEVRELYPSTSTTGCGSPRSCQVYRLRSRGEGETSNQNAKDWWRDIYRGEGRRCVWPRAIMRSAREGRAVRRDEE